MTGSPIEDQPFRARGSAGLADVVDALGTRDFGPRMAAFADAVFGGHVCFAHRLENGHLAPLAAGHVPEDPTNALVPNTWRYTRGREWERDACLARGMKRLDGPTAQVHFHDRGGVESRRNWPWNLPTPLVDKVLLCRREGEATYVLEFSRWGECDGFDAARAEAAVETGHLLISLAAAHQRLLMAHGDPAGELRSVESIEQCLSRTTALTQRERQVCALQLFGASSTQTATQLGIRAESVKSYRKRAYVRLGVTCERELLLKFLSSRATMVRLGAGLDSPLDPWRLPFLLAPGE
jgi:DNA-binding CsgD family transcriptional regulator